jgi:hypothetical protein
MGNKRRLSETPPVQWAVATHARVVTAVPET